jgi:hypothetical protein
VEGKGESSRWQAVAAIGTALAALVAFAAYLWPNPSASGTAGGPTRSHSTVPNTPQGAVSTETTPSPAASAPAQTSPAVLAQATVRVSEADMSGVNVDNLPVAVTPYNGVMSFWADTGEISAGLDQTSVIAAWPGSGNPTATGCANLLRTQPTSKISNHSGLQFCMEGVSTQRVAAGRVLSYDGTVSEIQITVWNELLN